MYPYPRIEEWVLTLRYKRKGVPPNSSIHRKQPSRPYCVGVSAIEIFSISICQIEEFYEKNNKKP